MDKTKQATVSSPCSEDQLLEHGRETTPKASWSSLPPELHLLISKHLTYPDALSLKHVNRPLYNMVYTGVHLKIEWLIERRRLHLDCPHDRRCELGSDLKFCRGSVKLLMKRRREHGECDTQPGGRGCLVYGTPICTSRRYEGILRRSIRWTREQGVVLHWRIQQRWGPDVWSRATVLLALTALVTLLVAVILAKARNVSEI